MEVKFKTGGDKVQNKKTPRHFTSGVLKYNGVECI